MSLICLVAIFIEEKVKLGWAIKVARVIEGYFPVPGCFVPNNG